MKNTLVKLIAVSLIMVTSIHAAEKNKEKYKDKILRSTSNLCWTSKENFFNSISIQPNESNVFKDIDACLKAGGKLSKSELALSDLSANEENDKKSKVEKATNKFYGINWGLGFAYTNTGVERVIEVGIDSEEVIVDGNMTTVNTVNLSKSKTSNVIAMLETHYFFGKETAKPGYELDWAHGPYIAIGITGEDKSIDPLSVFGMGWMVGFKRQDGTSFNIGLGYFIDSTVKQLRRPLVDGGTTTITDATNLTVERDEEGYMLMFSANF